ncbi:MAG: hypothetical protein LQ352_000158 [Teloschistes flavicans]|nr:MAG: hypothetical protein LQ352_000158 [Teloschistes flavicans]
MTTPKIVEGVFAVNKPKSISSAQVLRDIQRTFNHSRLFAPWLDIERARRAQESNNQRKRRKHKHLQVKLGHGGTLDPMATGVLIVGVGKGTKYLQNFLACTKTYEASVLFGAATDSYDVLGKVLNKAPVDHISRESVEQALDKFRGSFDQMPPIYSALRMDGKHLYEYAREGEDLPREIEARPVKTESLELREWLPAGYHEYTIPEEGVEHDEKAVAERLLQLGPSSESKDKSTHDPKSPTPRQGAKRGREREDEDGDEAIDTIHHLSKRAETVTAAFMSGALPDRPELHGEAPTPGLQSAASPQVNVENSQFSGPPAAKLSMTVTSGFYVRSLCHDLGKEVGSFGIMSELVRTKQAGFELGRNVIEYEDLCKDEDSWGPQVAQMLFDWQSKLEEKVVRLSETSEDRA